MAPEDELDVKGLRAELIFVKGTLDKLGVQMEFEHVGKYKDAPDMFTKNESSPETREVINQVLDQFYGDFVNTIAEGRKKAPDAIRALIDKGPFVGKEALNGGLVDALVYEDQMYGLLKQQLKLSLEKVAEHDYLRAGVSNLGLEGPTKIALLVGRGTSRAGRPTIRRRGWNHRGGDDPANSPGARRRVDQGRDSAH